MPLLLINGRFNCPPVLLPVFAYGATGAGTTYTTLGSEESPGIGYLTVTELYKRTEASEEEESCEVLVSCQEVTPGPALAPPAALSLRSGAAADPAVPRLGYLLRRVSPGQPQPGRRLTRPVQ